MSEKIFKIRKELNLSQDEFGAMLSVSRQAVSKWELGQSSPDIETLRKMKQLFDISYEELIDDNVSVEHNSVLIINLRRKRHYFYYSLLFVGISLVFFFYYVSIRLNGVYDAFTFNSGLKVIQSQQAYDLFYYFIKFGLLMISGVSLLIGTLFVYLSQRKENS